MTHSQIRRWSRRTAGARWVARNVMTSDSSCTSAIPGRGDIFYESVTNKRPGKRERRGSYSLLNIRELGHGIHALPEFDTNNRPHLRRPARCPRGATANRPAPPPSIALLPCPATARRAHRQLWSLACADSAASPVVAQLPRSLSASSERDPGSAVYVKIVRPGSMGRSSRVRFRLSSPTTGW